MPTRLIGEQHVLEDLGRIHSLPDWLTDLPLEGWMLRNVQMLSRQPPPPEDTDP